MKRTIISVLLVISMLVFNIGIVKADNNIEKEKVGEEKVKEVNQESITTDDDIKVIKLDYGVSVELEPDKPIHLDIEWWHNFSLNITEDLNTNTTDSILSYSWGNQFLNFNISYSRSFFFDNKETDNGKISFSFSQDF